MTPGQTELMRIPSLPYPAASVLESPSTPALAAAYYRCPYQPTSSWRAQKDCHLKGLTDPLVALPTRPRTEEMFTMLPLCGGAPVLFVHQVSEGTVHEPQPPFKETHTSSPSPLPASTSA